MVYNFQKTEYRLRYKVQQLSENPVIGMVKDNTYKYTGNLEIIDESEPANMVVKFPLSKLILDYRFNWRIRIMLR